MKTKFEKFSKKPSLNKDVLKKIKGGTQQLESNAYPTSKGCGLFFTFSGECRPDGSSCWPWRF